MVAALVLLPNCARSFMKLLQEKFMINVIDRLLLRDVSMHMIREITACIYAPCEHAHS